MRMDDLFRDILDAKAFWFPCLALVESFNADEQTAKIKPLLNLDGVEAPVIEEALVLEMAGAGWEIDFHLAAGDVVLAIFCMTPTALWRRGVNAEQDSVQPELHNAVVLPGVKAGTGRTSGTSVGVTLRNSSDTIKFEMSDAGIALTVLNPTGQNITIESLTGLFNLLTHTHAAGTPNTGPPNIGS